jgi:MFS family permease
MSSSVQGSDISILPILLVNFIGTLGYSIILPFLIVLVLKFGGNELIYGVMGATYSSFQFIGAPILGKWSDNIGRKKVLLISQSGTFLAWTIFVIALVIPNSTFFEVDNRVTGTFLVTLPLILLFLARALDGLTGGNVSVANAYLADITSDQQRKSNFGKMSASANLGFILGPAMAGILGATIYGELVPVLAAMLISMLAIFVISIFMKESNPCILSKSVESSKIKKVMGQEHIDCYELKGAQNTTFKDILKLDHVPYFLALYFLIFLAFNLYYVAFPVHAVMYLEWDLFELGLFFSVLSGIMVLVQGPVLNRISGKFSEAGLILSGSIMLSLAFILFTNESVYSIGVAVVLFAAGNGIMWPSFLSLLSEIAPRRYQGAVQGFASSAGSLASIIGLITGGLLYTYFGIKVFWVPGIIMFVIFLLCLRLENTKK